MYCHSDRCPNQSSTEFRNPEGLSAHPQVSSAREVLAVLVEGHGHDAVGGVEGLLDPIAVVNVNVNVENTLVVPGSQSDTVTTSGNV